LQADLGFADRKRVAVDDVGLAGDHFAGIGCDCAHHNLHDFEPVAQVAAFPAAGLASE
jgi:hypothetical protein